jgi:hypothetical protein
MVMVYEVRFERTSGGTVVSGEKRCGEDDEAQPVKPQTSAVGLCQDRMMVRAHSLWLYARPGDFASAATRLVSRKTAWGERITSATSLLSPFLHSLVAFYFC